ncbi:hypothetical protein HCA69_03065 [Listeria grandensis]|uniref:Uncharacterized protein n=1 Tax=Listeria grandensis TaxID=1494963 RepID=A0A7X0Y1K9_9LIST|nr:hypothetical protein [Listeria grandensis]MBC1935330.1 hypothetical protein [Listeria grandensis]
MRENVTDIKDVTSSEIITENLIIKDNLLRFSDLTIQLSNISFLKSRAKTFKIPGFAIFLAIMGLIFLFAQPIVGIILCGITSFWIWSLHKSYKASRFFLIFYLNSGQTYHLFFGETDFLNDVRRAIETSMNDRNKSYAINIKEQRIIDGEYHEIRGENVTVNSHNSHTVDASVRMGDIKNSSMQGVAFGNENIVNVRSDEHGYDWDAIKADLASVIAAIKIETPLKAASIEALSAAENRDPQHFEAVVKRNKLAFVSDLFQNTASQFLAQVIVKTLGV